MELQRVYFHAFRSLLNKDLEIRTNCIGFVGTNESGKSNLLDAIYVMSGDLSLSRTDAPKMARDTRDNSPYISYIFKLDNKEREIVENVVNQWRDNNTIIEDELVPQDCSISYHVRLSGDNVDRWFEIEHLNIDKKHFILKPDRINSELKICHQDDFLPIKKALIITYETFKQNLKMESLSLKVEDYLSKIHTINTELKTLQKQYEESTTDVSKDSNETNTDTQIEQDSEATNQQSHLIQIKSQISKKHKQLENLKKKIGELNDLLDGYGRLDKFDRIKQKIDNLSSKILETTQSNAEINDQIELYEKNDTLDETQKKSLATLKKENTTNLKNLKNFKDEKTSAEEIFTIIQEPFKNNYSQDIKYLKTHLSPIINDQLNQYLPKIVFWEYDPNYLLKSETLFSEILDKVSINDIPRPLVNTFRIGLKITDIESLKEKIKEIQNYADERSRLSKTLTNKINEYLKSVWSDYDQDIQITLEKERIRVEIFDPKRENASYYSMIERSQGFQTFVSFLLTIGAEALHGVIKNTILLLDEPETHLHPSGVRFMLRELIRIAESGNIVMFATHSIFMIDRNDFDRHIILNKNEEETIITPACQDRIGFFMQEEVLYNTLDVDLNKDFDSTNIYNFVFEGQADSILFKHFYYKLLSQSDRPYKLENTSFYHGGKCSDILKYFKAKPIQLGTKWIFILDSDQPADKLASFINSKYKRYLESDIYVYQYGKFEPKAKELEDLLPEETIIKCINQMYKDEGINFPEEETKNIKNSKNIFAEYSKDFFNNNFTEKRKAIFKEILNDEINKQLSKLKKNDVEEYYSKYFKWAKQMVKSINRNNDS